MNLVGNDECKELGLDRRAEDGALSVLQLVWETDAAARRAKWDEMAPTCEKGTTRGRE
jgi:hypothetical protein